MAAVSPVHGLVNVLPAVQALQLGEAAHLDRFLVIGGIVCLENRRMKERVGVKEAGGVRRAIGIERMAQWLQDWRERTG